MDDEPPEDWWNSGGEFPPAKYPVREAFTFCLVVGLVLGILGWGIWTWAWLALGVWG